MDGRNLLEDEITARSARFHEFIGRCAMGDIEEPHDYPAPGRFDGDAQVFTDVLDDMRSEVERLRSELASEREATAAVRQRCKAVEGEPTERALERLISNGDTLLNALRSRLDEQVKVADWCHAVLLTIDQLSAKWRKRGSYCRQVAEGEGSMGGASTKEAEAMVERVEAAEQILEAIHGLPGWSGEEGPTGALAQQVYDLERILAEGREARGRAEAARGIAGAQRLLAAENDERELLREQGRAEVLSAVASDEPYCGHCGEAMGGEAAWEDLHEHIRTCPKHPLAAALHEADDLRQRLEQAEAELGEARAAGQAVFEQRFQDGRDSRDIEVASLKRELAAAQAAQRKAEELLSDTAAALEAEGDPEAVCDAIYDGWQRDPTGTAALDSYVADATAALRREVEVACEAHATAEAELGIRSAEAAALQERVAELRAAFSEIIGHDVDHEEPEAGLFAAADGELAELARVWTAKHAAAARSEGERVGEERERGRVLGLIEQGVRFIETNTADDSPARAVADVARQIAEDIRGGARPSTKEEDGHG